MNTDEQIQNQSLPQQPAEAPVEQQAPETTPLLQTDDLKKIVETLLFITDRPVKPNRLADVIDGTNTKQVREVIQTLQDEYVAQGRAVQIVEIGGGFQMATKPEYGRWVRKLYNEKMTTKLSTAALETLAIIAYKQPITRAEMEAIRGVDVAGPLEKLLERSLVRVVGKKDTIGRPMVYGTTDEFLRMFGLNKLSELPDLQVFAAKNLHEKQEDLPFGDPLPPLNEPAIIPLEELEPEERLEVLDGEADPFFKRNSYNRGDFFQTQPAQEPETQETSPDQTASNVEAAVSENAGETPREESKS
ncbi:MAG: SMC-Scp complex subunit ScpB [Elusimicrobiaceae bacterium]|nr:SMC-Scp complex subunit ScpB [Elusimicrobiaceae bacterium]